MFSMLKQTDIQFDSFDEISEIHNIEWRSLDWAAENNNSHKNSTIWNTSLPIALLFPANQFIPYDIRMIERSNLISIYNSTNFIDKTHIAAFSFNNTNFKMLAIFCFVLKIVYTFSYTSEQIESVYQQSVIILFRTFDVCCATSTTPHKLWIYSNDILSNCFFIDCINTNIWMINSIYWEKACDTNNICNVHFYLRVLLLFMLHLQSCAIITREKARNWPWIF